MHLKRIELTNYRQHKKLDVDFSGNLIAVLGQNGCGKSNVCDAIKWVLGEQNARNIRSGGQGKTMQEVIFKGTNNRKPMGYCEVSLVFDNSDRAYKIEFDELIITRKLFRSGDSKALADLLSDPGCCAHAAEFGLRWKKEVEERYTVRQMIEKLDALYRRLENKRLSKAR